jgi:hypothetical protein
MHKTVTSYDAATGGNIVNQVRRDYNPYFPDDPRHSA